MPRTTTTTEELSNIDPQELSNNELSIPVRFYVTWDPNENGPNLQDDYACLGLDDFFFYNLMLLCVLPPLSSLEVQIYVLIGHIIAVQIGQEATHQLGRLFKQWDQPALPLPVMVVTLYAVVLQLFLRDQTPCINTVSNNTLSLEFVMHT